MDTKKRWLPRLFGIVSVMSVALAACTTTTTTTRTWGEPAYSDPNWVRYGHVELIRETIQREQGNPAGGAVAGAIIGGTTGAAIAAQGQPRANGYYWYNNGCYVQRPDGAWIAVAPQYCGAPPVAVAPGYGPAPVAPAAAADDDEVEYIQPGAGPGAANADAIEACARRYRSYDRRSMTFLSNDGMRKPCP